MPSSRLWQADFPAGQVTGEARPSNKQDLIHLPTGLLIELEEDFGEEDGANAVGEKGEGDFTGGGWM